MAGGPLSLWPWGLGSPFILTVKAKRNGRVQEAHWGQACEEKTGALQVTRREGGEGPAPNGSRGAAGTKGHTGGRGLQQSSGRARAQTLQPAPEPRGPVKRP